ncbi:MAG: DUF2284 domain-containing protein [Ruminococcus sp.]
MEKILVIRKNLEKVLYGLHKRSEKTWFFKYGNHGHKRTVVFKPEYRKFCEENQCGCYNVNPACPPECGTVETMKQRVFAYEKALILQTIQSKDMDYKMAKLAHNKLTEQLASKIMESGNTDLLIMSAGPYRHYSRLSASTVLMPRKWPGCGWNDSALGDR